MSSRAALADTVRHHKIDVKKMEPSIKAYDYYTQNFFPTTDAPIPTVPLGEQSRRPQLLDEPRQDLTVQAVFQFPKQQQIIYPAFNIQGVPSRTEKSLPS